MSDAAATSKPDSTPTGLSRHRRLLLVGVPIIFLLLFGFFYLTGGRYVATDDAYVQAARTDISSNIAGRVTAVNVHDNQVVHRGDVLFTLDDRELKIAVESAKAALQTARLQVGGLKATYQQHQADVKAAQDTVAYLKHEYERQQKLAAQGISSQIQLDQARHAYQDAIQQVSANTSQRANVSASLNNQPDIDVNIHPTVMTAQAVLDRAELNLSYATVRAPVDGIVTKVDQLQVGNYINAAVPVFTLLSKQIWIDANFKETELTYMRVGQAATIEVDSYPGRTFHGKVESLSPGTGSSFALLPPENATGNWVKVVQRLAVRISIDDLGAADQDRPLHAGLSAYVAVDTQHRRIKSLTHD